MEVRAKDRTGRRLFKTINSAVSESNGEPAPKQADESNLRRGEEALGEATKF